MGRYLLALLLITVGCSRFARVDGYSHRSLSPYVDVTTGGRFERGALTLEASSGFRFQNREAPVPVYGLGVGLDGAGWSAWATAEWEHGDDNPGIFFGAEIGL
jgi:hypothetical protein